MGRPRKLDATPPPALYRKIEIAVWQDERFSRLSRPAPNAQTLWTWLLTGKRTHPIPGVVVGREAVMADDLRWPLEGFREAFAEIKREGMAEADWDAGLVLLRKARFDGRNNVRLVNRPQSVNVVIGWSKRWIDIPECSLKDELFWELGAYCEALGEAFAEAFAKSFPMPSPNVSAIQEQDAGSRSLSPARAREESAVPAQTFPVERSRDAFLQLADAIWGEQETALARLRREGVGAATRPLGLMHPGKAHLVERISERAAEFGIEQAAADCRHALDVLVAEARRDKHLHWFDGRHWTRDRFSAALARSPMDTGKPRRADRPQRGEISVAEEDPILNPQRATP